MFHEEATIHHPPLVHWVHQCSVTIKYNALNPIKCFVLQYIVKCALWFKFNSIKFKMKHCSELFSNLISLVHDKNYCLNYLGNFQYFNIELILVYLYTIHNTLTDNLSKNIAWLVLYNSVIRCVTNALCCWAISIHIHSTWRNFCAKQNMHVRDRIIIQIRRIFKLLCI